MSLRDDSERGEKKKKIKRTLHFIPKKFIIKITSRRNKAATKHRRQQKQLTYKLHLLSALVFFATYPCLKFTKNVMISSFFYPGVWWNNRTVSLDAVDVVKYKEYVFWNEESSSYKQILPKNATNAVYFYSSSMLREQVRYMHIKNIYCSPGRGIATADAQVRIWPDPIKIIEEIPTNVSYEHIIFLYSEWGNVFGHFLQDCLSQLTWFPKRLIDKSMIMISFDINQSMPYLKVFGIPKEKVIYYQKSWFYAYNLYMALPTEAVNSMNVYSFKKVVKKLRKRFKVDSIKAAKYVVTNRKRRMSRCIKKLLKIESSIKSSPT